ncbi:uncharacterized protein DEA37_0005513 [Paragonimus westermani]|uniref:Uncharacterized protein n=1 Tax=Paragonimus westermani TaxID=34504 RepID=A0A5J4NBZ7_9TREM|nr:uncharacterized protein DEA37_0005513 [Paragonimus westermani]
MFAGNTLRKKHIQSEQANPNTDVSRTYWKTRRNSQFGKANRNVIAKSRDLTKSTDKISREFSNGSPLTCFTKYNKWQASDTVAACYSAKPIKPSKKQLPVLYEKKYSFGLTSHIRKLVRSNSVPPSVTQLCCQNLSNLSQVHMKFREHSVRVRNRPQSTPKNNNLFNNAESVGQKWTSISGPSNSAVTWRVRECADGVYGGEGTSHASETVSFNGTARSGNHEILTYPSQSYLSNLSSQLSNRTISNASWQSKRNKDSRPPWFPAGKGGSAISHHRQFQVSSDRLRITSLLRKVASRTLLNSSHILKRSSQRTFMEVGLENLRATTCPTRIRDINSVLPHSCCNHLQKSDTVGEPTGKAATREHTSFPCPSIRSPMASPQGFRLFTIGQRYPPIGPRVSRKSDGENSVDKLWLTSSYQDRASNIKARFGIPQSIRVSNTNIFLYTKPAVQQPPSPISTIFLKRESDYMKIEVLNQVPEDSSVRKNAQSVGDPDGHVPHKRIIPGDSSTFKCNKMFDARESDFNGCASPDLHSAKYHTALARSLTSLDLDVIASSFPLDPSENGDVDQGYLETPQFHIFAPANDPFIGVNGSTASTSQALSLGPVTYASLWDKTADETTQSEVLSTNCVGSSPEVIQSGGMVSLLDFSQKEPNDTAVTKRRQNLPSVSEETIIHVTDVSDFTDNQYSSLASEINSIVYGDDMSLNIGWKTNDELEAFELSKTSTRSSLFDEEVSHIDSPQLVTAFKDESLFFLLNDGDCDMSHRVSGDTGARDRVVIESPLLNSHRQCQFPSPTSSVQDYVIHDPVENKLSKPQTYRINNDSLNVNVGVEQNPVILDHGRGRFLRKIKCSVRSLSNRRKKL